jgi:hypothetical protein
MGKKLLASCGEGIRFAFGKYVTGVSRLIQESKKTEYGPCILRPCNMTLAVTCRL